MDILSGSIERVTFYNPENGYSVVRLRPEPLLRHPGLARDGTATIIGNLPELTPGEHVRLQGRWANHAKHGLQFQVEICEQIMPATTAGIRRYLGSGLIKGIGPHLADRIVKRFGAQTLEVIEHTPELLQEVPDIGPVRSKRIAAAWQEQRQVKEIMLFLHSHGVSTNLAIKIYKTYQDQALVVVQTDPYRLARDIYGVGFKTADKIARALGLPSDHPSRLEAGVVYALNEMTDDGHVYAPQEVLVERAAELLELSPTLIPAAIERLALDERVRLENLPIPAQPAVPSPKAVREPSPSYGQRAVYLTPLYASEVNLAERLRRLAEARPAYQPRIDSTPPAGIQLSPEQQAAVETALKNPLSILTGGPGTGKTTALKTLIIRLEALGKRYALVSPTGRAAKRLSEATGRPASTIHRLLGPSPAEGFKFNSQNPLLIDFLVLDEASMLDLILANSLLKALQPGTHLLLVGDVDQLPSVGAGDVLRDLIASDIAPVTRLNVIFRQAQESYIIANAHRINHGEMPAFATAGQGGDFFFFPAETPEETANWVQDVVCKRIPQKFGIPAHAIQVLAPMYRGPAGVTAINQKLQESLNPPGPLKPEKTLFGTTFRPGDKIMQTQNNYEKEVYNGDIGSVLALDPIEHSLMADFDGRPVLYDWSECDQLVLAYAVSVHKSQGSEFPAVVIPLVTSHYLMLQRNLLYTAVTRAKKLCVLVGSRKAIWLAVQNNQVAQRYTALDWRLQQGGGKSRRDREPLQPLPPLKA